MKRLLALLLLLLVFAPLGLLAQNGGMPSGHRMLADPNAFADGHVAALDRQVQLTEAQKAKLRPVFLDEGQRLFAIINSTTMPTEQKQSAIQKLHEDTAAKVNSLLTPEQRQIRPAPQMAHPTSQT
jgi:Spy/CpxP family protein refolding chaperone